ncbi:MAG TPA: nucleotide exchange factor GrpE [Polyangiaceae bacterium]|nr:nucleotide exchange factor GrpE [Polyangiaceae bacterium]
MHGESSAENDPREGSKADPEGVEGVPSSRRAPPATAAAETVDPLAEALAELQRVKETLLRTAADFDNFRKRTRRELEEARRNGREDLLRALLPVFDNLERAIQSALRSTDIKAMAEGLTMVQRQFVDALGREGISRVSTVGRPFDPSVHEAIQQVGTDEHPPGTVIAEVQPGYMQGERLMRAAMVVVARPKSDDGAEGDQPTAAN